MDINGPIERGIEPRRGLRGPAPKYVIDDLQVGDSRRFGAPPNRIRAALWPRAKALGITLRTATDGDGTRVWRIA